MNSLLLETPFFAEFPNDVLVRLEEKSVVRKFKKNTHLMICGDECHSAYVMLEGSANAYTDDANGEEFIINSFRAGDCFGELGVLDDLPRTANVITTTACECMVIPKTELRRAIEAEPGVAQAIIKTLVGRIRGMTEDVSCLALMDVYGRLARVLGSESKIHDDGVMRMERITHQELSKRVGASREMISKILKDLKTGGYISIEDHRIAIIKKLPERW
ncbi:MAG: Crp/Fnr family transcriptional regulator [Granulosicoccus sp.]